jgi:HKD family nuclease
MKIHSIMQPEAGTTLDALTSILDEASPIRIDIAVAYITSRGAEALLEQIRDKAPAVQTRWLTSFDYFRTEPLALDTIRKLAHSKIRVHDAAVLGRKGATPIRPFHPKTFIVTGTTADFVLAGSGNLSKSGLTRGHEAGIALGVKNPPARSSAAAVQSIDNFRAWFDSLWNPAATLTIPLLDKYAGLYESQPNLSHPTPTDDDIAPANTKAGQLSPEDLRKLRVCRHLWIEAGRPGKNLGDNKPGNQLMMKRLTRVFFGIDADDVPKDTALGQVELRFKGKVGGGSLTYSNNGMDKITLPAPPDPGPPKYDDEDLLFTRIAPGVFDLELGSGKEKAAWIRRSKAIGAAFKMQGGRQWGAF